MTTAISGALLAVDRLSVRYGQVRALDEVSVRVDPGEVVAVVGPNGAGKTTLLRTISGLVPAAGGTVDFGGTALLRRAPHRIARAGLAHVPEGRGTIATLTVDDNLRLGALALSGREVGARLDTMYDVFPMLGRLRRRRAGLLSGGEQQMMVVARGLMASPRMVMIDEPSMGLAPIMIRDLVGMLRAAATTGVAILLVEQNLALATQLADRSYVLVRGTIRAESRTGELPPDLLTEFLT